MSHLPLLEVENESGLGWEAGTVLLMHAAGEPLPCTYSNTLLGFDATRVLCISTRSASGHKRTLTTPASATETTSQMSRTLVSTLKRSAA